MIFNSKILMGRKIPWSDSHFSEVEIKKEIMLFNCDRISALKYAIKDEGDCGRLTLAFLEALEKDSYNFINAPDLIIDSRVHMLMSGKFYPAIPGYHHDDVPREREDRQPNYINPSYKSQHVMMLVNGDICPTEFALGEAEFPEIPFGETYYKIWHPIVLDYLKTGKLKRLECPSNQLIYFDWNTWHRATIARKNGWRFFIRASINTGRKPTNEIRRQVQVYLENPMEGW